VRSELWCAKCRDGIIQARSPYLCTTHESEAGPAEKHTPPLRLARVFACVGLE